MFVQTEITPNPNSLKFIPGKVVSSAGSFEVKKNDNVKNELIRNILSVNGVEGIFLSKDFISVNKHDKNSWEDIKHIVISHINEFYASGKEFVISKDLNEQSENFDEIETRIVKLLEEKIRPAIARDGGDIKFKSFKKGVVEVELRGSCSGCPSAAMTLKQGVQNLLKHYVKEVNKVEAI